MLKNYVFTSESVTEGHPDKLADQISDAILDEFLRHDPKARVACETLLTTGLIHIAGEVSSTHKVDYAEVARDVIKEVGYDSSELGLDYRTVGIITSVDTQSPDIANSVDSAEDNAGSLGAGDQGMMFGYASKETPEFMPLPIVLSHKLSRQLSNVRKSGKLLYLRPDGKTQVSVKYEAGKAKYIDTIVISTQHDEEVSREQLKKDILAFVIEAVIPEELITAETKIHINPSGRFVIGGPQADVGLTGRKIIVDTYGGWVAHGGGAFSGKDSTKVDRSASYMARYIAKNLVAADVADEISIEIAYAIGRAEPVSIFINTNGSGKVEDERIIEIIKENFDLTPDGIINTLGLRNPIFRQTSTYGHFGRTDIDLPWEKLDKVDDIKRSLAQ
ncbi:methionine adenosyltransferase [Fastidiosipila sanguinis]|uniref:S-adenosylmethionine synthase n=1 Tax=Fastidiosipila sanguinis TaxID=236753 RepID=A0A2S0KNN1_9FIRM|nr:methionine adenosyltransferase [Fastidiosipila sanguinis]AVM42636.1 methionine adenosyltransferase [Fastidiosipila sanguinis]